MLRPLVSLSFCLSLLIIRVALADAPRYTVTDMGLTGKISQAEAINNQGQVVGWQDQGSFLWENGKVKIISTERYQGAHGINEAGQIVGIPGEIHIFQSGSFHILSGASAFIWDRGYMDSLPGFSEAYSINAQGQIAGQCGDQAALWERRRVSGALNDAPNFIWQSLPVHKIRPLPGYLYGIFYGLNGAGEAVGAQLHDLNNVPEHGRAFRYQYGKATLLPMPVPGSSAAFSDNIAGVIVGSFRQTGKQWQAALWRKDNAMQALGSLPNYASSVAHGINAEDQVVGWVFPKTDGRGMSLGLDLGPGLETQACLWQGGSMLDLNTAIAPNSGWVLQEARAINDKGWIVGGGTLRGAYHAFLLIPTSAS